MKFNYNDRTKDKGQIKLLNLYLLYHLLIKYLKTKNKTK
jgi:hypothetical protein